MLYSPGRRGESCSPEKPGQACSNRARASQSDADSARTYVTFCSTSSSRRTSPTPQRQNPCKRARGVARTRNQHRACNRQRNARGNARATATTRQAASTGQAAGRRRAAPHPERARARAAAAAVQGLQRQSALITHRGRRQPVEHLFNVAAGAVYTKPCPPRGRAAPKPVLLARKFPWVKGGRGGAVEGEGLYHGAVGTFR